MPLKSYINTVISPDDHSIDSNFMKIVLNKICDGLDSKTSKTEVGNLSDLNTTAKTNIVAAINEAATSGGIGFYALPITLYLEQEGYSYNITGEFDSEQLSSCYGISLEIDASTYQEGLIIPARYGKTRQYEISGGVAYEFGSYTPEPGDIPSLLMLGIKDGELLHFTEDGNEVLPLEGPGEEEQESAEMA